MANILVIRLSAIGDVAMTVPVIYSAAKANPTDSFTVLTQAFLIPVFINRPKNVNVIGINTKSTEKTLAGLLRFASALVKYDFDMVLDLHDVLRTMIIRTLFRLNGRRVFVVDKARKDRARLTDAKHKRFKQLRPVIERYADVFRLGTPCGNEDGQMDRYRPLRQAPGKDLSDRGDGAGHGRAFRSRGFYHLPVRWSWLRGGALGSMGF